MTTLPSFAAELYIQYEVIARTNVTAIPEGDGAFNGFSEAPAIDSDGNVVFVGAGPRDNAGIYQSGIYTFVNGQYQKVADKNTLIPDGSGTKFTTFYGSDLNDIDGGRVAFRANTATVGTLLGVYTNVGQPTTGDLVELAVEDGVEWSETSQPWVNGNKVGMRGKLPSGPTKISLWSGSGLSMNYVEPGTGYVVSPGNQVSLSADATIFRRYKTGSSQMVIDNAGSIEAVATIGSTHLPGHPGEVFSNFSYFPVTDQGGQDAAFQGTGGAVRGLYKRVNGGALEVVADTTIVAPGTASNVFHFFVEDGISLANGQVAFFAEGQSFLNGIYTDIGGGLSVIVDDQENNTIDINGQMEQVSDIRFAHKSFAYSPDGYMVVFRAALQSGGTAIIRATINDGIVVVPPDDPDIAVSGSGNFGDIEIGTSRTQSITVSNAGEADLVIGNLYGLASPFSISSDGCSGVTVQPAGSCIVSVRFSPTTAGTRSDTLIIPSNDPDQPSVNFGVNGSGYAPAAPDIAVSGNGAFGDVEIDTISTHSVTVSNVGDANLVIGDLYGLSAPFSVVSDGCSGATVQPSGSCSLSVRFAPTSAGTRSDTLVISSNDPDEANSFFSVNGNGTTAPVPDIAVSGNGAFGDVEIGTSSTRNISVSNVGDANLVIGNLYGLATPFSVVSDNCTGTTIAPAGSCSVSVRFTPTTTGIRSDTLVIPSNDPDEASVNFGVSGSGTVAPTPDITVSGNGAFGEVVTGTSSDRTISISNAGNANLIIGNLYGLASPFSVVSDNCSGATLAPGGSCSSTVRFAPTATGTRSDTLIIPSNDPNESSVNFGVSGTGTGTAPDIAVSGNGAFGSVEIGSDSTHTVTISNAGGTDLVMGAIDGLAAPFSVIADNCSGITLAPAASCTLDVRYTPTTSGAQSDLLFIRSNDPDEDIFYFEVTGTGTITGEPDISVTGNGAFGDVEVDTSSNHSVTVSNAGNADLVINNLFGLVAPFSVVSDGCSGQTITPAGSCTVSVRFLPTVTGAQSDSLVISSNDPDETYSGFNVNGTGTTAAVPDITVSGSGAFGDVEVDTSSTHSITVSNAGDGDLVIGNLYGLASPFSVVSDGCSGQTIAPAGSCSLSVRFSPTSSGTRSDTLVIPSNDPDEANINFGVNGNGTVASVPDIAVSGNGAFGDLEIDTSSDTSISVSNAGDASLVIGDLYGLASPFSIVADNCSGATLAPAGSCTVSVRFAPTTTGTRSDTLVIPSNDPDAANSFFGVSGTGTDATSQEVEIVYAGFEDGNADDWSLNGAITVDGAEAIGQYALRHRKSGTSTLNVSTAGYIGVSVTMNLAATSLESDDGCYAEVSTNGGNTWASVVEVHDGSDNGAFFSGTVSPSGADNNSNLQLRFRSTGQHKPDYCWGDEVSVVGTPSGDPTSEVIVDEGFEDGSANGWALNGDAVIDGVLAIGQYSLRHGVGATSQLSVSTAGYSNVSLTMHMAATSLKQSGGCYAEVSTDGGSSWVTVVEITKGGDDGAFISDTVSPAGVDDNVDLQLRFRSVDAKGAGGYCYGDNVSVEGIPMGG